MAKSALQDQAVGRTNIFRVKPGALKVMPGWNCRNFDDPQNIQHVAELKEFIRHRGVMEPLTVRVEGDDIFVVNGECRLRAVRELLEEGVEIESVPCQSEGRHVSEADEVEGQITRNSGKPFTPLELCAVFHRLFSLGRSEEEIAEAAGYTAERVRQIMSLNRATEWTKDAVRQGRVSATTVQRALEQSKKPIEAERAIRKAVAAAEKSGKTKIGPRHLGKKKEPGAKPVVRPSYKALAKTLVENTRPQPRKDGSRTIVVPADLWEKLVEIAA